MPPTLPSYQRFEGPPSWDFTSFVASSSWLGQAMLITNDDKEWKVVQMDSSEETVTALYFNGEHGTFLLGEKLTVRPPPRRHP